MKRFYQTVTIKPENGGFAVFLDARQIKTPAKAPLLVPTEALAQDIAAEWQAQEGDIKPASMPMTQLANTAIDRVDPRRDDVISEVAAYGGSDLLCYRDDEDAELVAAQALAWDPYLAWASETLGAKLKVTAGIMPVSQDETALARLRDEVAKHDAFELAALHSLTHGFGSLVLALAYSLGHSDFETLWQASLVDALHQEQKWGLDWETEDNRANLKADLQAAAKFISQVRNKTLE